MNFLDSNLYLASDVRQLDQLAIQREEIPGIELMRRAATAIVDATQMHWRDCRDLWVFCGGGNNGGDGCYAAAIAVERGLSPTIVEVVDPQKLAGDALRASELADQQNVPRVAFDEFLSRADLLQQGVVVDALLGTGLSGPVRAPFAQAIQLINRAALPVISADIPSGLSSDTGCVMGDCVKADLTISFVGLKAGLFTADGKEQSGRYLLDSLDIPQSVYSEVESAAQLLDLDKLRCYLPKRAASGHKGVYGHLLLVGGASGMGGAIILGAESALATGPGLISAAVSPDNTIPLLNRCPEVMAKAIESGQDLEPYLDKPTAIAIGPGLGESAWAQQLVRLVLESGKPLVLDADALNLIAGDEQFGQLLKARENLNGHVLTPHPGEAARLLGATTTEIQANRLDAVRELQNRYGGVVVLKGSGTIVCDSDQKLYVCPYGNPGMASGGMGDLLTGLIGGLMAQNVPSRIAASIGVMLHSQAGDIVADSKGMIGMHATELVPEIRRLINVRG